MNQFNELNKKLLQYYGIINYLFSEMRVIVNHKGKCLIYYNIKHLLCL